MDYTRQTAYSDPGRHLGRLSALPEDVAGIAAAVRNLVVHYRASGIDFPPDRLAEINNRWVERMLDSCHLTGPLDEPLAATDRIVGCCRDFTLLAVSILRARGIPARSRIGFADYLEAGFHGDHVIAEYHDGSRWIATDAQLDPAAGFPVDVADVPLAPGGFRTAAQAWRSIRRGEEDPALFGVGRGSPIGGARLVRQYVLNEVAHRFGDELLLWDIWGDLATAADELGDRPFDAAWEDLPAADAGDVAVIDEIAGLLLAADGGDQSAEGKLASLYASDARIRPGDTVSCHSPSGSRARVDLRRRAVDVF
ncbi:MULTISPECIES: transglutaminase-like domain-containing protein [Actinoplanes]|uniref:transglutaminase-like domain-containing protein n=1 Tax=Actinoplanes TaxID=1865 RepID=UPI0005F2FC79|nr:MULTISPECIES: transglutaminase-like domain-containing protein [Actinoplanes]GLY04655.1 hypothetical protein Acsp01_50340 [Actinoplanes sp. NBRC 101535]